MSERPSRLSVWLALLGVAVAPCIVVPAAEPASAELKFFEQHVRPLLIENCLECHSGEEPSGGLRLDSVQGLRAGGESGEVVRPGDPDDSLILQAVRYESLEMPPDDQLEERQVAVLERWIADGAVWPDADALPVPRESRTKAFSDEDRAYWAFQPVASPALPEVSDSAWCRNGVDHFILAALDAHELTPAPEADRRTLIRRLSYDLTGLPPTPEEVDAFLSDTGADAYGRLVERLLESPAYGQHWAQHWLDVVRYAESDGFKADGYRPDAWRYRDYVIRAFSDDLPYDRFVAEQLAGDELAPDDPWARVATGFLRHGVYEYNQRDAETQRDDSFNELTDLVGEVFLGLGFACARCHDHKFDPLRQQDYYGLQAFFAATLPRDDVPFATPEQQSRHAEDMEAWRAATSELQKELHAIEEPHRSVLADDAIGRFPPAVQAIYRQPAAERNSYEQQIADLVDRQVREESGKLAARLKDEQKERWQAIRDALADSMPKPLPSMRSVSDCSGMIAATTTPAGVAVEPAFPAILGDESHVITSPAAADSSGRRAALAAWLTRDDHPLTGRVIVNRLWHHHFGRGLVPSTSDFGRLGTPPSHPELLDWLARQLVEGGWSLKALHRLLVSSATYRQSAQHPEAAVALRTDPDNRLLWRWSPRRLGAEAIRDTLLAICGELATQSDGPGAKAESHCRSIFLEKRRNQRNVLLAAFDGPNMIDSQPERPVTTTALQALYLLNDPWMVERAQQLSRRVCAEATSPAERIELLYQLLYGRPAEPNERAAAMDFLDAQRAIIRAAQGEEQDAAAAAWQDLCHALLNTSELYYVD